MPQFNPPFGSNLKDEAVQSALRGVAEAAQQPPAAMHVVKNNLNGGELSPDMACRFDIPRYQSGCHKLLNMIPLASGGITKRPGLRHVAEIGRQDGAATTHGRLIPFVYSASLEAMLVLAYDYASGKARLGWIDRDGKNGAVKFECGLPLKEDEIREASVAQCGKALYFAHPRHKPFKVVVQSAALDMTCEEINFRITTPTPAAPYLHGYGDTSAFANGTSERKYVYTAVSDETGEESLPSPMSSLPTPDLGSYWKIAIRIAQVPGCSEYRVYKMKGGSYGFIGRITSRFDEEYQFDDDGIAPDTEDPPPKDFEGFQKEGDYPSIVFLHQQRLGFAASDNQPLTVWMSQTGNFECFAAKTPPNDDDGLEATLASSEASRILWAAPDREGVVIGTEGAEWVMQGAGGEAAITPNSISFMPQTAYGSEPHVPPVRCASSLVFCQRGGRHARDLGYSLQADRYEAADLAILSRHIFRHARIRSWAWQGAPECVLWMCLDNGKLAGLTHLPEHEVEAWHRHESPSAHFVSCAALQDSEGRSRLWVIMLRAVNGAPRYSVEMMEPRWEGQPSAWDERAELPLPEHVDGLERLEFQARAVPCLPEIGMESGAAAMRVKKINAVKARVVESRPFKCFVRGQNAEPTRLLDVPARTASSNARLGRLEYAEEADWACPIGAGFRDGARLELVFDGKEPATVLGVAVSMEVAMNGGGQI